LQEWERSLSLRLLQGTFTCRATEKHWMRKFNGVWRRQANDWLTCWMNGGQLSNNDCLNEEWWLFKAFQVPAPLRSLVSGALASLPSGYYPPANAAWDFNLV
jgi:hypothetical protein